MIEGSGAGSESGSIALINDPDPGGPKTCGSDDPDPQHWLLDTRNILYDFFSLCPRSSTSIASRSGRRRPVQKTGAGAAPAARASTRSFRGNISASAASCATPSGTVTRAWCRTAAGRCAGGGAPRPVPTPAWSCATRGPAPPAPPPSPSLVPAARRAVG
jgi:hypothetical protein